MSVLNDLNTVSGQHFLKLREHLPSGISTQVFFSGFKPSQTSFTIEGHIIAIVSNLWHYIPIVLKPEELEGAEPIIFSLIDSKLREALSQIPREEDPFVTWAKEVRHDAGLS